MYFSLCLETKEAIFLSEFRERAADFSLSREKKGECEKDRERLFLVERMLAIEYRLAGKT